MRSVYKYPISEGQDEVVIKMPRYAQVLHVGTQDNQITLWANVDTNEPEVNHVFFVAGTGWSIAPHLQYVGTAQLGMFVWHIFKE